jgi:spore coat protein A
MSSHPIHLHLVQFQLVQRQTLVSDQYLASWLSLNGDPPFNHTTINVDSLTPYLTGTPTKPAPNEQCWKDTIQADAGAVTTIRIRWAPQDGSNYHFDPTSGPGYVWHCHILDHEDNEMMRPYTVTSSAGSGFSFSNILLIAGVVIAVVIIALLIVRKLVFRGKPASR